MTNTLDWEIIRNDDLSLHQRKVIGSSQLQRAFLESAIDSDTSDFCDFFRRIGIDGSRKHNPVPQMTESEFVDPTWTTECQIWKSFQDLPPAMAATPGCWTRICLQAVEEGQIHAASLARPANSSKDANGLARIKRALNDNDAKEVTSCTTRIFRVMGGLLGPRGYRTTYIDCPLARSWWRHRVALNATKSFENEDIQTYSQILRSTGVWEPLMEHIVSKQTVIGFPTVVSAVVNEVLQISREEGSVGESKVVRLLVLTGGRCANQALDLLETKQVAQLISSHA